jgi:hypothetical protein
VVEVAAHGSRREVQPLRERRGRARPELKDRPGHPLTRGGLKRLVDFHNISVPLLVARFQIRVT